MAYQTVYHRGCPMAYYQAYHPDCCPVDLMDRRRVDYPDRHRVDHPDCHRVDHPGHRRVPSAVLRCLRLLAILDWSEPDRRYNGS